MKVRPDQSRLGAIVKKEGLKSALPLILWVVECIG